MVYLYMKNSIGHIFDKEKGLYRKVIGAVERPLLEDILSKVEGNQLRAAHILGINRNTLRAKIKKLGIDVSLLKEKRKGELL